MNHDHQNDLGWVTIMLDRNDFERLNKNDNDDQTRLQLEEGGSFPWAGHRTFPAHSFYLSGFLFVLDPTS